MTAPRIPEEIFTAARERIRANLPLRRSLPVWGRLHVDRQVPFLVVYRRPAGPDAGTGRLAVGHASYLTAATDRSLRRDVRSLATVVAETISGVFGACLVVELWSAPIEVGAAPGPPSFRVVTGPRVEGGWRDRLVHELARIRVAKQAASVAVRSGRPAPPGLLPLLSPTEAKARGIELVGIEVAAIFQNEGGAEEYPLIRRALQRELGRALGRTFFTFARDATTYQPLTYHALGRRAVVKAVSHADRSLDQVGRSFDLLFLSSPANTEAAWSAFRRSRYGREPVFRYRPLQFDPSSLKRRLWDIRIDRVEDPTLEHLFASQRAYLDRQIGMLTQRDTPAFLHDSVALFGEVSSYLANLAESILARVPPRRDGGRTRYASAHEFARIADAEIERYRAVAPDLKASVVVRSDVSTLLVSGGNLLVGGSLRIPQRRIDALIHHEVGTHLVTNYNGSRQRLRLLGSGLAGYEALQEGLAVLAEYLTGGLDASRLRIIAARVAAARSVADGAAFIETFRLLSEDKGLSKRTAFTISARVHRGGGFVKDAIYLRGLADVLRYLGEGGRPEVLLSGKFALDHVPVVIELQRREILKAANLRSRYLGLPEAQTRLRRCREGLTVSALVEEVLR